MCLAERVQKESVREKNTETGNREEKKELPTFKGLAAALCYLLRDYFC
jgi:hypothetical protein